MNRRLQWLNLAGVLFLAGLCALQWQQNRTLNLKLNRLTKTSLSQEQKISEQARNAQGLTDDLARFKEQFTQARTDLTEAEKKLQTEEQERRRLAAEGEQLRRSITNWSKAVTERDAQIKQANERIVELAGKLNESVVKFNQLATNYEAVVKELNESRRTNAISSR